MNKKEYESVKIEKTLVQKVRKHTDKTKQSISGFFSLWATEGLKASKVNKP